MVLEADRIGAARPPGSSASCARISTVPSSKPRAAHGLRASRRCGRACVVRHSTSRPHCAGPGAVRSRAAGFIDLLPAMRRQRSSCARSIRRAGMPAWITLDHAGGIEAAGSRSIAAVPSARARSVFDPLSSLPRPRRRGIGRGAALLREFAGRTNPDGAKLVEVSTRQWNGSAPRRSLLRRGAPEGSPGVASSFQDQSTHTPSSPSRCRRPCAGSSEARWQRCAIGTPPQFLRWMKEDGCCLRVPTRSRSRSACCEKMLVQRTGELMYELSLLYPAISGAQPEWAGTYEHETSADGLPSSASTGTSRATCSRSDTAVTAPPPRGSPRGCSCVSSATNPRAATNYSVSGGFFRARIKCQGAEVRCATSSRAAC